MSFTWPAFLWLLLLVPVLMLMPSLAAARRRHASRAYADPHLLERLSRRAGPARVRWTTGMQLAAVTSLLLAAGRPVATPHLPVNQAAVVIALDASRSMLADDVSPTRLEVARELAASFVRAAPRGTRIGLVTFSDGAASLVAPSTDRDGLLEALAAVEPAMNTSLTAAVLAGVRALPGREEAAVPSALARTASVPGEGDEAALSVPEELPPGRMILFSDGGDNVSVNPELPPALVLDLAARFALDQEVPIFTVPVGREGGAVTRIDGALVFVPFEVEPLERLADLSGGRRLDVDDGDAMAAVFRELGTARRWQPVRTEVSALFVAGGALLMLIAAGLGLSWQRRVP
jgi:Ca-activated chloride channel homolog